jgi:hypothetical protein
LPDSRLPNFAAMMDPLEGPIIMKKGERGFWKGERMALESDEDIARFNTDHNASPAAVQAMHFGSMFGWETPGATLEAGEEMARRAAAR